MWRTPLQPGATTISGLEGTTSASRAGDAGRDARASRSACRTSAAWRRFAPPPTAARWPRWWPRLEAGRGRVCAAPSYAGPGRRWCRTPLAAPRPLASARSQAPGRPERCRAGPCRFRAAGEDLLVTAIIPWNTRYLEHAVAILRQVEDVPDHPLAHLSPLVWEHVNLTGDHAWAAQESMAENTGGLRPLRNAPEITRKAA